MKCNSVLNICAIIPARGNSKAVPRKNKRVLGEKPLIAHSIDAAKQSQYVTHVFVSTEDKEIASIAENYGADVPYLRPKSLSEDHVHAVYAVVNMLEYLIKNNYCKPDIVVMLLPTSPFRTSIQIDAAIDVYMNAQCDSVVSVVELDKQIPHLRIVRDNFLQPIVPIENCNVQRQDLEVLYALNGSIYVSSSQQLIAFNSFHMPNTRAYIMDRESSLDINTMDDWIDAEKQLAKE